MDRPNNTAQEAHWARFDSDRACPKETRARLRFEAFLRRDSRAQRRRAADPLHSEPEIRAAVSPPRFPVCDGKKEAPVLWKDSPQQAGAARIQFRPWSAVNLRLRLRLCHRLIDLRHRHPAAGLRFSS